MIQNGKNVAFFISAFLLLETASFGMNKEEGFFSKWFGKKKIASKENKGNILGSQLNKKAFDLDEGFKMENMKEVASKKKEALEDWVLVDGKFAEEYSMSHNKPKEDVEIDNIKPVSTYIEDELNDWENVDDESLEEYVSYDPMYSNNEKIVMLHRLEQIKKALDFN